MCRAGISLPSSYSSEPDRVLENDSFVEDGISSYCNSPSSTEDASQRNTNVRRVFVFDNRTDELMTFEDSDAEATLQSGNTSSRNMTFSPESDSVMFAHEGAQNRGKLTWQTYKYDDEQQTSAATIFYNFEDDSS